MTEDQRDQIASFRYQVIAPLVNRELSPGEASRILRELARKNWEIPLLLKAEYGINILLTGITAGYTRELAWACVRIKLNVNTARNVTQTCMSCP